MKAGGSGMLVTALVAGWRHCCLTADSGLGRDTERHREAQRAAEKGIDLAAPKLTVAQWG
jgi:hypothetical protein